MMSVPGIKKLERATLLFARGDPSQLHDILTMEGVYLVFRLDPKMDAKGLAQTIEKRFEIVPDLQDCAFEVALCWLDMILAIRSDDIIEREKKISTVMCRIRHGYLALFGQNSLEHQAVHNNFSAYPGFRDQFVLFGLPVKLYDGVYTSTLMHGFKRLALW